MIRREAADLYGWLQDSYPRNYKDADPRRIATTIDNLAKVFANCSFREVMEEYERVYATRKNEPHPSEIRAAIKAEVKKTTQKEDPLVILRRDPRWDEICRAYGEREVIRQARICAETASMGELKFRLERDQ